MADAPNWATGRTHRALLIGNGRLGGASERFGPLRSPPGDVAAVRAALTDAERGLHSRRHVQVVLDAPRERVLAALRAFFDGAGPQDQLLLFYSGHGLADERGALHLGSNDTMAQFPVSTAVPAEAVAQLADASPAAAVLIILDCRYGDAWPGSPSAALAGPKRLVLASPFGVPRADDGDRVSAFSEVVAAGLTAGRAADRNRDGLVSFAELCEFVTGELTEAGDPPPECWLPNTGADVPVARVDAPARGRAGAPDAEPEWRLPGEEAPLVPVAEAPGSRGLVPSFPPTAPRAEPPPRRVPARAALPAGPPVPPEQPADQAPGAPAPAEPQQAGLLAGPARGPAPSPSAEGSAGWAKPPAEPATGWGQPAAERGSGWGQPAAEPATGWAQPHAQPATGWAQPPTEPSSERAQPHAEPGTWWSQPHAEPATGEAVQPPAPEPSRSNGRAAEPGVDPRSATASPQPPPGGWWPGRATAGPDGGTEPGTAAKPNAPWPDAPAAEPDGDPTRAAAKADAPWPDAPAAEPDGGPRAEVAGEEAGARQAPGLAWTDGKGDARQAGDGAAMANPYRPRTAGPDAERAFPSEILPPGRRVQPGPATAAPGAVTAAPVGTSAGRDRSRRGSVAPTDIHRPGSRAVGAERDGPISNLPRAGSRPLDAGDWLMAEIRGRVVERGERVLVLVGPGAVGPASPMVRYAGLHAGEYQVCWWLRAHDPALLAEDWRALAAELGLPAHSDLLRAVPELRGWLQDERHGPWLLVLDGAPAPEEVAPYVPRTGRGQVLITATTPGWEELASSRPLSTAPPRAAEPGRLGAPPGPGGARRSVAGTPPFTPPRASGPVHAQRSPGRPPPAPAAGTPPSPAPTTAWGGPAPPHAAPPQPAAQPPPRPAGPLPGWPPPGPGPGGPPPGEPPVRDRSGGQPPGREPPIGDPWVEPQPQRPSGPVVQARPVQPEPPRPGPAPERPGPVPERPRPVPERPRPVPERPGPVPERPAAQRPPRPEPPPADDPWVERRPPRPGPRPGELPVQQGAPPLPAPRADGHGEPIHGQPIHGEPIHGQPIRGQPIHGEPIPPAPASPPGWPEAGPAGPYPPVNGRTGGPRPAGEAAVGSGRQEILHWDQAVKRLRRASPQAAALLQLAAFLDSEAIPVGLLAMTGVVLPGELGASLRDPQEFRAALATLAQRGMVAHAGDRVAVPPLAQVAVGSALGGEGVRTWAAYALRVLGIVLALPAGDGKRPAWAEPSRLLPHAEAAARHALALGVRTPELPTVLNEIGVHLLRMQRPDLAVPYLDRALGLAREVHGLKHREVVRALDHLAVAHRQLGDEALAMRLHGEAVAIGRSLDRRLLHERGRYPGGP